VGYSIAETLHRLVKQAIDSGEAASVEEAHALFAKYKLRLEIDAQWAREPHQQAVLLTAIALARRVFLGGVDVVGELDVPLLTPARPEARLAGAVAALGGRMVDATAAGTIPVIWIGPRQARRAGFAVRTVVAGWRGGIVPLDSDIDLHGGEIMPLSAMLAAGLAVNEAFLHASGKMAAAGRRAVGMSLWQPDATTDWLRPQADGPSLRYLPSKLWLIGLGHLGQAYLWGLSLLPYDRGESLALVLQDVDRISPSSESTSVLSNYSDVGVRKTRAMAAWAEARGFNATVVERLFAADFRRQPDEPSVALCGLDNALGRQALDQVGFDLIVEAGLGRGHQDFRRIRLHTLPGRRGAAELWPIRPAGESAQTQPAYSRLRDDGVLDRCGMTVLAGKAVGAPFVGAVAASLALAEVLRLLHGSGVHQVIDIDLLALDQRVACLNPCDFSAFNPGFVALAKPML
jgi:hypothetical protein